MKSNDLHAAIDFDDRRDVRHVVGDTMMRKLFLLLIITSVLFENAARGGSTAFNYPDDLTHSVIPLGLGPTQRSGNQVTIGIGGSSTSDRGRVGSLLLICSGRFPVRAFVSSPDNRGLQYTWTSTGGGISGSGSIILFDTFRLRYGDYKVKVRVEKRSGELIGNAQTTLRLQACLPNVAPAVTLSGSRSSVCVGGKVNLQANASDPDGDTLLYTYSSSAGRIIGEGSSATWDLGGVAPGVYTASVEVDDGYYTIAYPWTVKRHITYSTVTVEVTTCRR